MSDNVFSGLGVRVKLKSEDDFLKVKETLTRIGIASNKDRKLYQTAHILHKRGEYAIMHFKEMFILDGRDTEVPEEDIERRSIIASLLEEWGLVEVIDRDKIDSVDDVAPNFKILPYREKESWTLVPKYTIGRG